LKKRQRCSVYQDMLQCNSVLKTALTVVLAVSVSGSNKLSDNTVVAHEWGTFTSVAGADGASVSWAPLNASSDLPCFVKQLANDVKSSASGLVRMETPVLYFYSKTPATLSVHVDFPRGWITEWFPEATRVQPARASQGDRDFRNGQIEWNSVQVTPGESPAFPGTTGASHYYAARNTDSAALRIGEQREKFLFYRGIANFQTPVQPSFESDGSVKIRNTGADSVPVAILFDNRNGKFGYRFVRDVKVEAYADLPERTGDPDRLREQITDVLVENGLYRKEAIAMFETWRDSWFEEGTRVFYIVPRSATDALLPLKITPAPARVERVFVGRAELLSPWMEKTIGTALDAGDIPTLSRYGRFLDPFVLQLTRKNRTATGYEATRMRSATAEGIVQNLRGAPCVK
jgi:hypothetical protein